MRHPPRHHYSVVGPSVTDDEVRRIVFVRFSFVRLRKRRIRHVDWSPRHLNPRYWRRQMPLYTDGYYYRAGGCMPRGQDPRDGRCRRWWDTAIQSRESCYHKSPRAADMYPSRHSSIHLWILTSHFPSGHSPVRKWILPYIGSFLCTSFSIVLPLVAILRESSLSVLVCHTVIYLTKQLFKILSQSLVSILFQNSAYCSHRLSHAYDFSSASSSLSS